MASTRERLVRQGVCLVPGPVASRRAGTRADPLYPADGATLTYPDDAFRLTWSSVPRTYKYLVTVSEDPALATPLEGFPLLTSATTTTRQSPDLQAGGTYYWRVTPQDSRGNTGSPSVVSSFQWDWLSTMSPALEDLVAADELFDPRFSWALLPGAASYRVEVNSDDEFDTGSKVLDITTIGSSLTTRQLLPNNTYYWRVRAVDAHGHEGDWNVGATFQKSFADETVMGRTSVTNLRMLYPDADSGQPGHQTTTPVVVWDPVPGASGYNVEVGSWDRRHVRLQQPARSSHRDGRLDAACLRSRRRRRRSLLDHRLSDPRP